MIRISVDYSNGHLVGMRITGHAGSAEYGRDLVCAAVSAVAFGLLNALDQLSDEKDLKAENNLIEIRIHHPDEKTDLIMKTGLIQLETIAEGREEFIKITNGGA